MAEKKDFSRLVVLFFGSVKMMAFQSYDISPYSEILRAYDDERDKEKNGEKPNYISYTELCLYIQSVNLRNYGVSRAEKTHEKRISYLLTNHQTGKIKFICFFNTESGDLLSEEITMITNRAQEISKIVNDEDESDAGFSGINSCLEVLVVTRNKISPYPKERVAHIDQIKIIDERLILSEPYNNMLQSSVYVMSKNEYAIFKNIPKSNLPSISSSDAFMTYLGIDKKPTKLYRGMIASSDPLRITIHYKNVNSD